MKGIDTKTNNITKTDDITLIKRALAGMEPFATDCGTFDCMVLAFFDESGGTALIE